MQLYQVYFIRLVFVLAFISGIRKADAQTAVKVWDQVYGRRGVNEFNTAIKVKQGGFLVGTTWAGTPQEFETRAFRGGKDFCIFKTDDNGKPEWSKNYGSLYDDNLTAMCQTKDGGFLLGGIAGITDYWYHDTMRNVTDISEKFRGKRDIWIIKTDARGNKEWDCLYGGDLKEELAAIVPLPDGFLLAGSSESGISGDKSEKNRGGYDYWVIKTDLKGNKLWDKTFGGQGFDKAIAAVATPDGGYLIGGNSNSEAGGDKTQNSRTIKPDDYNAIHKGAYEGVTTLGTDFWVIKLNAKGEKQWDRRYGGPGDDFLKSMVLLKDGSFVLGGTTNSGPGGDKMSGQRTGKNFAGNYSYSSDYWLVKIGPDGRQLWENPYGGNFTDEFSSLLLTSDDKLLLAGHSSSGSNGDKSEAQHTSAVWLVKTDLEGNKIWDKQFIGLQHQYGERVKIMEAEKGQFVFASLSNTGIFGDRSHPHVSGLTNMSWLVKVKEVGHPVIFTGKVIPALCDSKPFEVPFTALGNFQPGNVFTVQLSDPKGRFRKPTIIGRLENTGNPANTILASIPGGIPFGEKYRLRVVASDPATTGTDNGTDFGIGRHSVQFVMAPAIRPEGGVGPYYFSLDDGNFVKQNFYEQLWNAKPGQHTVTVRDSRNCTARATFNKDPDQVLNTPHTVSSTGTTMVWHSLKTTTRPAAGRNDYLTVAIDFKFEGDPGKIEVYFNSYQQTTNQDPKQKAGTLKFAYSPEDEKQEDLVVVFRDMQRHTKCTYTVKYGKVVR